MNIPMEEIRDKSNARAFSKGRQIRKLVYGIKTDYDTESEIHISAYVEGSNNNEYYVNVYYDENKEEIYDYQCECPAFHNGNGMCKHCVALALHFAEEESDGLEAIKTGRQLIEEAQQGKADPFAKPVNGLYERQPSTHKKKPISQMSIFGEDSIFKENQNPVVITSREIVELINHQSLKKRARYIQPAVSGSIEIMPIVYRDYWNWSVDFKIGNEHKYVLKDINALLKRIDNKDEYQYGMKLSFLHDESAFTPDSLKIIEFLRRYMKSYKQLVTRGYSYVPVPAVRTIELAGRTLSDFLHTMCGKTVKMENFIMDSDHISITAANPSLVFRLDKKKKGRGFSLRLPSIETVGDADRMFIRILENVYECDEEFSQNMYPVCKLCDCFEAKSLDISEKDMTSFCTTLLPVIKKYARVECDELLDEYQPEQVVIKIYLDKNGKNLICRLDAEYGAETYNILKSIDTRDAYRDLEKEGAVLYIARKYFDSEDIIGRLILNESDEDKVYQLLLEGVDELRTFGDVYVSDSFKKLKVNSAPKVKVGVSINAGLLDLTFDTGDLAKGELEGILSNYRLKKKYYRLKNGDFVSIEDNSLAVLSEMTDTLAIKAKDIENGLIELPQYRSIFVDQLLSESESFDIEVRKDKGFKRVIRELKSFEDSDFEVPPSLDGIMRKYQETGYRWLRTIDMLGFGGILADDMGLGKSIQIISFLLGKKIDWKEEAKSGSDKDLEKHRTSLIVCPASLIYNWENEIEKFGKGLKALIVAGSAQERKDALSECEKYDVVVTSYDLLKRDIDEYADIKFYAMIIDEAQNIKNHTTQAARAVKEVSARVKFALTGTPIENRLSELWSIFDYLMPGLLFSYTKFKRDYETGIIQTSFKRDDHGNVISTQNDDLIRKLQKMIRPFIMRRVKEDVLKEIPDKNEEIIYSKLSGEQQKLYLATLERVRRGLKEKSDQEFNNDKLRILAAITRLRQICCAPALVYEEYKGESAKMDTCMELISNAMEAGHKILLFSQFTSIFDMMEKRLKKEHIPFYRLDGSTSKLKRAQLVEEFNADDTPLFLISLKAGGTGLNLTSASIVIHFDPWWNIAAQNQATDRAHRIGQTKEVSVFKLIARGTIEEKILKLQEAKKELSDQVINEGGASMSALTRKDFEELLEESTGEHYVLEEDSDEQNE